ncbi:uncharacterized protein OCT59_000123 [Rhizophagus irregularis]|uniref:uncharacterized protein n=1 Tax=Rhizophagus irregularis TaxID=588596 RepID=UPI00332E2665|nr:hypothetical protein OCT59_000123 [Rhizophagus irregularis]
MNTSSASKNHPSGSKFSIIFSYLERYSKHSYRGFLKVCHDEVVASTPFSDHDWRNIDDFWANQFLVVAKLQLDNEEIFISLLEKVRIIYFAK